MLNNIITIDVLNEVFAKSNECYDKHINTILAIEVITSDDELLHIVGSCMLGINPDNTNLIIVCGLVDSKGRAAGAIRIVCSTDLKTIILSYGINSHIKL